MASDDIMQTFRPRIITNGDRLRAMSNQQLARFLNTLTDRCAERECERCPIGRAGEICNEHTICAWLIREADG